MKRWLVCLSLLFSTCVGAQADLEPLTLPDLDALSLDAPLTVVATTSIIGDVVAKVGGDAITLTTLLEPGQDPHGFEPAARDLAKASEAQAIFVNGWGLEASLLETLQAAAGGVPFVPVSAGIAPLEFAGEQGGEHDDEEHDGEEHGAEEQEEHEEHDHAAADPHTWLNVTNVMQWATNIQNVLSALDPNNADTYAANAAAYRAQLEELEAYAQDTFSALPEEQRKLVTNHDAFGYLAAAYNFEVVGAVIPSLSTVAEPSAGDLTRLIAEMEREGVCTLFNETTSSSSLAETVAAELDGCDEVQVLSLYTGALGPTGSGADSYLSMMRNNIDTMTAGLGE